ncbi:sugar-binding domain-containing protein [Tamlana flava]|uniref:sugar-binding domain-containing protein n=1 Tax=Tamlana flava TaxID=3158572 RepID=UPI00351B0AC6
MTLCYTGCNIQNNEITKRHLFDLNWKFSYGDPKDALEIKLEDSTWHNIDLPHDWSKDFNSGNSLNKNPFEDSIVDGWYRKHFEIPEKWDDKNISICFDGISNCYEIYINNKRLGKSVVEASTFKKAIDSFINIKGDNLIAIKISVPKEMNRMGKTNFGIYSNVWLEIKDSSNHKD